MTVIIDLNIHNLLERKYIIQNTKNWLKRSYWFKQSELQKIDNELHEIIRNNFTKVLLPEKKYADFTFDDFFETFQDYYIFDDSYIPLGRYIETYFHKEMVGITDPVQIQFINAIFEKDSTGSNIYTRNDTIISRPIYIKNIPMNSATV
jgi:hypothetical protein